MLQSVLGRTLRLRFAFPLVLAAAGALLLVSETSYDRASDAVQSTRQHVQARVDMRACCSSSPMPRPLSAAMC